jgi:hypothetical protein
MHKRWSGGRVALLCAIRDGGTPRAFVELAQLLAKDCVEARLASADIARELDSNSLATAFDSADFASSLTCASSRDCPVLLAILHDIDPKLRGTVQQTMGVSMPAIDSTVRFFVYSVKTSELVYTGQFKEVAGKSSEIRLAARIAGLIIERYLVPHCPAVEGR